MTHAVLASARHLGPQVRARSAEIEALGTLPLDLVDAIRLTGAFRLCVPDDLGGPGVTVTESLKVFEEFAYHDGSVGWCVAIGSTTSVLASYLPDPHAADLFGDSGAIGGGFVVPRGRAVPVDGGLLVSGRWQWGSGVKHCTTIGGGCLVVGADGRPKPRPDGLSVPFVFMDPGDLELLDTWDVAGLAGTGSVDFEARDVYVPEGRWVQLDAMAPVRDNVWSRFSFYGLLASGVGAVAVGIARRSIDELVKLARAKKPQGSTRTLAERAATQAEVAKAEARLAAAWTLLVDAVDDTFGDALVGRSSTVDQRRHIRMAATHATQTAADVAALMFRTAGGAAVYRTSPIQRCLRDTAVAAQHAMVAPRTLETVGRMRLGLETETSTL
ncbi:MAG: acyl-CoA dehydrogenase family protein [bacterium]|nr:acyl-CoA dehydrogenase family protein [bacterium]MDE0602697.1 acyl-CoA dehydrogenase family protein [bacterium]